MDSAYLAEHCGTRTLGHSTHGMVVDGSFYYIANSGWDAIDEHGKQKLGASIRGVAHARPSESASTLILRIESSLATRSRDWGGSCRPYEER